MQHANLTVKIGEKNYNYFIGYCYDNLKVKPLHMVLSKTSVYVKRYDTSKMDVFFH